MNRICTPLRFIVEGAVSFQIQHNIGVKVKIEDRAVSDVGGIRIPSRLRKRRIFNGYRDVTEPLVIGCNQRIPFSERLDNCGIDNIQRLRNARLFALQIDKQPCADRPFHILQRSDDRLPPVPAGVPEAEPCLRIQLQILQRKAVAELKGILVVGRGDLILGFAAVDGDILIDFLVGCGQSQIPQDRDGVPILRGINRLTQRCILGLTDFRLIPSVLCDSGKHGGNSGCQNHQDCQEHG